MTQVLVDTCVWVSYFRSGGGWECEALSALIDSGAAAVNGIIEAELFSGAKTDLALRQIETALECPHFLEMDRETWRMGGKLRALAAGRGFAVALPDALIAATALIYNVPLFSTDGAFLKIAGFAPLKRFAD